MQGDLVSRDAQGSHVVNQALGDSQESSGPAARLADLRRTGALMGPVVNIRTAGLDRNREPQDGGNAHGGIAIGMKELRVDQVKRLLRMQSTRQWQRTSRTIDPAFNRAPSLGSRVKRGRRT